jgi:hypothetical protein
MANICSNFVTIIGDDDQLKALYKRLMDQDPTLIATVPNFEISDKSDYCILDKDNINWNEGELSFNFGSRYDCPFDEIGTLSTEYPDLEFSLFFDEAGNDYFGEAFIKDGSCDSNELEERAYCEKYHGNYKDELAAVKDCSYEDFLKNYTHDNFFEEHPYAMIDRDVVERIKDEDLALFISREWMDEDAKEEYHRRLSGGSTVEPETE